jgi:hypothetical protein
MEDSNSAYKYKLIINYYARYYIKHGIILMPHPSISPDINLIEKY